MRVHRKLKSQKGFSLAETLLAVLILLLVSIIVATGTPAAKNAYYKVILASNAQTLMTTTTSALRNELGMAWNVSVSTDGTKLTYFKGDTGGMAELSLTENGFVVKEYSAATDFLINNKTSDGEARDLVPRGAATDQMIVACEVPSGGKVFSYDKATKVVTITGLKVKKDDVELASLDSFTIRVLTLNVEPIAQPAPTLVPNPNP